MHSILKPRQLFLTIGIALASKDTEQFLRTGVHRPTSGVAVAAQECPVTPGEWHVIFEDQFLGDPKTATGLDLDVWSFDLGTRDMSNASDPGPELWGNNEPQYYTDRPENVKVVSLAAEGATALKITAQDELFEGMPYTSARVVTRDHPIAGRIMPPKYANGSFVDGGGVRIEARVKLPQGSKSGTWPAVWMLPTKRVYGLWPHSGEIDIMESKNTMKSVITGLHFGGPWYHAENVYKNCKCSATLPPNPKDCPGIPLDTACKEDFKTWAVEWTVNYSAAGEPQMKIEWFQNGWKVHSRNSTEWWSNEEGVGPDELPVKRKNGLAPFDQPFYIIMNLSVGGSFAGPAPEGMRPAK